MFFRAFSSITKLSRGSQYLLRPTHPAHLPQTSFSLTARSFSAVSAAMADTSGVTAELLQKKLEDELEAKTVKIEDLSGKFFSNKYHMIHLHDSKKMNEYTNVFFNFFLFFAGK